MLLYFRLESSCYTFISFSNSFSNNENGVKIYAFVSLSFLQNLMYKEAAVANTNFFLCKSVSRQVTPLRGAVVTKHFSTVSAMVAPKSGCKFRFARFARRVKRIILPRRNFKSFNCLLFFARVVFLFFLVCFFLFFACFVSNFAEHSSFKLGCLSGIF